MWTVASSSMSRSVVSRRCGPTASTNARDNHLEQPARTGGNVQQQHTQQEEERRSSHALTKCPPAARKTQPPESSQQPSIYSLNLQSLNSLWHNEYMNIYW